MAIPRSVAELHERFCGALTHRYFIRAHMSVMLGLVLLSGVLGSRLLLHAGLTGMQIRYPLAVVVSYLVFFGLVRMWLAYVCRVGARRGASRAGSSEDGGDLLDGSWGGGSGSGSSGSGPGFAGGGGGSGGAGSSGGFGDGDASVARSALPVSAPPDGGSGAGTSSRFWSGSRFRSAASGSGGSGGGGGDGDGLLLLILFGLLVAAICGAGVYLVYQAPAILSEAAFQAVLAGGLVRTARGAHEPGWAGSVLKATAIPFALVLALSGIFGYEAHKHCPGSRSAREVLSTCLLR